MPSNDTPDCQRRTFLRKVSAGAGVLLSGAPLHSVIAQTTGQGTAPALVTADKLRPQMPSGVMSGDISRDKAIIWSRADRPSRMVVEYAVNENFQNAQTVHGPIALSSSDFSARVDLGGLPAGQTVFYRVRFQDIQNPAIYSAAQSGSLLIPGGAERDISFAFFRRRSRPGLGHQRSLGRLPDL